MFAQLDRELRFGYQKNGSLVLAFNEQERDHLADLKKRGETNGVERLRIIHQEELREMEPYVHPEAIAALYSPDAGNVIPYEFTIALAENAVDNGVELRIRRKVTALSYDETTQNWTVVMNHWEPHDYISANKHRQELSPARVMTYALILVSTLVSVGMGVQLFLDNKVDDSTRQYAALATYSVILASALLFMKHWYTPRSIPKTTPMTTLVEKAGKPVGKGGSKVSVDEMLVGGSGATVAVDGNFIDTEEIRVKYVINCAGGASDEIARMIGDNLFTIKPRLGDYLLLNRNQVSLL